MTPKEIIYQAIGEASMCWENTPTGIFDSTRAKEIGDRLWNQYESLESRLQKLERVVDVARDITEIMKCDVGSLTGMHIDGGCDKCRLSEALEELDQP